MRGLLTMVFSSHLMGQWAVQALGMISNSRALEILSATVISMLLESHFQSPRGLTDVGFPQEQGILYTTPNCSSMGRGSLNMFISPHVQLESSSVNTYVCGDEGRSLLDYGTL